VKRLLLPVLATAGMLMTACIIQFSTLYEDSGDRTHFVALASNLTDVDVVDAVVEVRFFDSSNNLLATEFVSPCTRTLQAHQSSPVESVIPAGVTADRTETVVHPLTFGERRTPDFDFEDVEFTSDDAGTHVTGTIENNDGITYRAVQVCAAFFDEDGNVVRVGRAFTDQSTLSGGEDGVFDIVVEALPSDAETYQLWVDATKRNPVEVTAPVVRKSAEVPTATATPTRTGTPTSTSTPTATATPS
jgi:hypothetical protein